MILLFSREETLRIVCVFDYKTVGDDVEKTKEELSADVANTFSVVNSETNQDVLKEHTTAWNEVIIIFGRFFVR